MLLYLSICRVPYCAPYCLTVHHTLPRTVLYVVYLQLLRFPTTGFPFPRSARVPPAGERGIWKIMEIGRDHRWFSLVDSIE